MFNENEDEGNIELTFDASDFANGYNQFAIPLDEIKPIIGADAPLKSIGILPNEIGGDWGWPPGSTVWLDEIAIRMQDEDDEYLYKDEDNVAFTPIWGGDPGIVAAEGKDGSNGIKYVIAELGSGAAFAHFPAPSAGLSDYGDGAALTFQLRFDFDGAYGASPALPLDITFQEGKWITRDLDIGGEYVQLAFTGQELKDLLVGDPLTQLGFGSDFYGDGWSVLGRLWIDEIKWNDEQIYKNDKTFDFEGYWTGDYVNGQIMDSGGIGGSKAIRYTLGDEYEGASYIVLSDEIPFDDITDDDTLAFFAKFEPYPQPCEYEPGKMKVEPISTSISPRTRMKRTAPTGSSTNVSPTPLTWI